MSRFFDISPGVSVDLEEVEAIQEVDPTSTIVWIKGRQYTAAFPFETLKAILRSGPDQEESSEMKVANQILTGMNPATPTDGQGPNPSTDRFETNPAW